MKKVEYMNSFSGFLLVIVSCIMYVFLVNKFELFFFFLLFFDILKHADLKGFWCFEMKFLSELDS